MISLSEKSQAELSQKIKGVAIALFLIFCPIAMKAGMTDMRIFQEHFYQVAAVCLISLFIGNLWLTLFLLLNVYLFIHNGASVGAMQVGNILFGCLLFRFSKSYFKKEDFKPYFKIFLMIAGLSMVWMIFQHFGIDPIFVGQSAGGEKGYGKSYTDTTGLFALKAANGIYLAISLIVTLTICPILSVLFVPALIACRSSAAILALGVSLPFYIWQRWGRKVGMIAIAVMLVGTTCFMIFDLKDDTSTFKSRFPHWHQVIKYSVLHPQGYGPDSFRNLTKDKQFEFVSDTKYKPAMVFHTSQDTAKLSYYYANEGHKKDFDPSGFIDNGKVHINRWQEAHNEYIQAFFEYGFLGMFLIVGLLIDMVRKFNMSSKTLELITIAAMLLAFLVTCVTQFPFHLARLGYMFPILLGVFYAKAEQ